MKILTSDMKVRATELLLVTRGAKATIIRLRRWYNKIRSSYYDTGKTGVPAISTDRSTNRENEINQDRLHAIKRHELTTTVHDDDDDDDEMKNFAKENLENELRELMMFGISTTGSHPRA